MLEIPRARQFFPQALPNQNMITLSTMRLLLTTNEPTCHPDQARRDKHVSRNYKKTPSTETETNSEIRILRLPNLYFPGKEQTVGFPKQT